MTSSTMVAPPLFSTLTDTFVVGTEDDSWEEGNYLDPSETSISLSFKTITLTPQEADSFDAIMRNGSAKPKFDTSDHSVTED